MTNECRNGVTAFCDLVKGLDSNPVSVERNSEESKPLKYTDDRQFDPGTLEKEMAVCKPEDGPLECKVPEDMETKNARETCLEIERQATEMKKAMLKYKEEADKNNDIVAGIGAVVAGAAAVGLVVATAGTATPLVVAGAAAAGTAGAAGAGLGVKLSMRKDDGADSTNQSFTFINAKSMATTISDVQNITNIITDQQSTNLLNIKGCDANEQKKILDSIPEADKVSALAILQNHSKVSGIEQTITQEAVGNSLLEAIAKLIRKNTNDITTEAFLKAASESLDSKAKSENRNCQIIDASNSPCDYLRTINCCNQQISQTQNNILAIEACNVDVSDISQNLSTKSISTCGGKVNFDTDMGNKNTVAAKLKMIADAVAANIWVIVGVIAAIVIGVVVYKHFSNKGKEVQKDDYQREKTNRTKMRESARTSRVTKEPLAKIGAGYRTSVQKVWKKHKLLCLLVGALIVIHITKNKK